MSDAPSDLPSPSSMDFDTMMALEQHGPDTYVGVGPSYPWGGLYGGQIVAQALRAAAATVPPEFRVHSLHAYFIRRGDSSEPIRFEVDRIRNGRSFATRLVVARQPVGAILNMSASFQVTEEAPEVQTARMRDIPGPEALDSFSWTAVFERTFVPSDEPGVAAAWIRMAPPIGEDPLLHACALAFVSDDLPTEAIVALHPDRPAHRNFEEFPFWSASLDHAIWFHRPFRADEWLEYDFTCHGLMGSRGLAIGHVFTEAGEHVATITQEAILRTARAE